MATVGARSTGDKAAERGGRRELLGGKAVRWSKWNSQRPRGSRCTWKRRRSASSTPSRTGRETRGIGAEPLFNPVSRGVAILLPHDLPKEASIGDGSRGRKIAI